MTDAKTYAENLTAPFVNGERTVSLSSESGGAHARITMECAGVSDLGTYAAISTSDDGNCVLSLVGPYDLVLAGARGMAAGIDAAQDKVEKTDAQHAAAIRAAAKALADVVNRAGEAGIRTEIDARAVELIGDVDWWQIDVTVARRL